MRLSPARFDRMLRDLGQRVSWRRAAPCPCRDPNTGQGRYGCLRCRGLGTIWGDPIPAWTGLSGMKLAREYAAFGRWESGDVVLTIPGASPLFAAGEHDRILMMDSSEPFQLVLTHDGTDAPACVRDGLVVQIDRCFWLGAGDAIVEGDAPVAAPDGTLSWAAGANAPEPGQQFSIVGRRRPEYFLLIELPQDRAHHGGLPLPRRVAARRFQLFGNIGPRT
ncbi:conserved protein of unknown function (plasmid) [Rhodovastum atsumiense]|uniref:Uncharacterized protein n=1 Tax=Rhodovastum atsumiense TaxID=504468 RepID=A0A5M6IW02_9PROT|nr:hypothetical protein [Rhodovastum atsumiense]KAA5611585.1 hypothetical protein F1189_13555 [Rhodovastum atsumiense]CAH2606332.1 conserved protein of unknown function [Rhodovastum atsumiense]